MSSSSSRSTAFFFSGSGLVHADNAKKGSRARPRNRQDALQRRRARIDGGVRFFSRSMVLPTSRLKFKVWFGRLECCLCRLRTPTIPFWPHTTPQIASSSSSSRTHGSHRTLQRPFKSRFMHAARWEYVGGRTLAHYYGGAVWVGGREQKKVFPRGESMRHVDPGCLYLQCTAVCRAGTGAALLAEPH